MKFDLVDIRAFLAVADLSSFRAASDALHLSQSAVSRRVDKLEAALGVKLLDRTTRRVELTSVGRSFVPRARNVLNELESALVGVQDIAQRLSGLVTIACVPSAVGYFLPDIIRRFHEKYPQIRVKVIDESSSTVLTTVARGDADFGLTYIGTHDADIDFTPLLEDPFVVAVRRDHPLAKKRSVAWEDLEGFDFISLAQGSGNRFLMDQAWAQTGHRPRWLCEVQHVPALISLVEAGLGVGVVPRLAMPPANHATLVSVKLKAPALSRTLGLIHRRGRSLSVVATLLFELLVQPRGRLA
ncbi:LysR family transcriptional regulator [Cupriavidus respiraculi]|uniref:HTH-type transcriptional regulator CynR n=1 Tax=Cupriavidus respiraculi TaxID=195930 RepID=A0ABN7Y0W4_9BURK|nr:LysR family transcriptional regulator [Cupriavidus respiraculi]MBY4948064.1 LysR family transcriptional regulator [Cupriavidus respiraculi]CAG9167013.1 HTH-type transcriptional regulator CynR [Cupriavidus respiraculi]